MSCARFRSNVGPACLARRMAERVDLPEQLGRRYLSRWSRLSRGKSRYLTKNRSDDSFGPARRMSFSRRSVKAIQNLSKRPSHAGQLSYTSSIPTHLMCPGNGKSTTGLSVPSSRSAGRLMVEGSQNARMCGAKVSPTIGRCIRDYPCPSRV